MVFRYGFQIGAFLYGWHKRELYRIKHDNHYYPIKKLDLIPIGKKYWYRCGRKITQEQAEQLTMQLIQPIYGKDFNNQDLRF